MFFRKKAAAPSPARRDTGRAVATRLAANPQMTAAEVSGVELFYHLDFLDAAQCDTLIAMIDADRRPSSLL